MYNFIKKVKDEESVTIDDVLVIEKEYNFKLPELLKEYYLSYNAWATTE